MLASDISALVSMPRLLSELGFKVDCRSRRSVCILHGGKTFGSFSWRPDGLWHCFVCGRGGDKISLVQEARHCDFKDSVRFLAALANVSFDDDPKIREELARRRRELRQNQVEQARLKAAERRAFLEARAEILSLEWLRRHAGRRLEALADWGFERFAAETELAWLALELVARQMPRAVAAFTVIAFSDAETRTRYATQPEQRATLVDDCVEFGGVRDSKGHFVGIAL